MTEAMEEREKKSLLFDRLISSGADFADRFGWLMADSYGDTEKEYRSVRQTVGLVDLSFCGAIKKQPHRHKQHKTPKSTRAQPPHKPHQHHRRSRVGRAQPRPPPR